MAEADSAPSPLRRIAANSAGQFGAQVVVRGASLVAFLLIANRVEAKTFGLYNYGLQMAATWAVLTQLSLQLPLMRAVSRAPERAPLLMAQVLAIRLLAAAAVLVLAGAWGWCSFATGRERAIFWLLLGAAVTNALALTFEDALRAVERFAPVSWVATLSGLLVNGGMITGALLGRPIAWAVGVQGVAALVVLVLLARAAGRALGCAPWRLHWDPAAARELLALAIGLALVAQIAAVYGRVDLIVLRRVCGDGVVGQYAVPLRILDAALAAVVAVGGVLQPVLLRALAADAPRLTARTEASVRVLLLASLPAALGVSWLATAILAWFKPEYAAGGPALAVLVWLAPVTGVTFVLHSLLAAAGRAPRVGLCIGLGLATNWALCWLLVPRHGLMGAAWAKLSAELAIALASVWAVRPVVRLGWHRALGPPLLLTAASVATGAWAGPLAGLVVYGGLAAALGVFRGAAWRDA